MKRPYHIVTRAARQSAVVIEQFCRANGQILLPILKLIENASQVVETVIHEIGHQTLEQISILSAQQVAGPRTPGKARGESPQSGVERRTDNVTRWRDAGIVQRWVASAWLLTEKHFRRIDGHTNLWALAAILGREGKSTNQSSKEKIP